ncbi:MAG: B12-binding domain-containing protein [Vicinamibacteria bacterium]
MRPRTDQDSDRPYLSIGGLSRSTGVSIETLRTWELRYGFPRSVRKPSGHRQFEIGHVDRIRRIVRALELGFRAGEVVPASDQTLQDLLSTLPDQAVTLSVAPPQNPKAVLELVRNFDGDRLMRSLHSALAHQDPVAYVETRIAPCLEAVGAAWAAGELEIAHEHFASERISDVLRETRLRFEETANGPFVVLATVPGESHGLGLQITALVLSSVGLRVLSLGTEVPVKETAALAIRNSAVAVGISVSAATRNTAPEALTRLRAHLPRKIELILGGSGAPATLKGAKILTDLQALRAWAKAIA